MTRHLQALLTVLLPSLLVTGCSPRSFGLEILVSLPEGFTAEEYEFTTSVYAPGAAAEVGGSCDDFLWGEHERGEIASALVRSQPSDAEGGIETPRTGHKLIFVDALGVSSQKLGLTGCAVLGEIEDETTLEVALEPVARIVFGADDELLARVPFGASTAVSPAPSVMATDDRGLPLADVAVRVAFTRPDGSLVELGLDDPLTTTSTGTLTLDALSVETMGPFAVNVRARVMLGDAPEALRGFAVPAQTVVTPFGEDRVLGAFPAPIGPAGIAFIAQTGPPGAARMKIALPMAGPGLPSFDVVEVENFNPAYFRVLGAVWDSELDEGVALFQQNLGTGLAVGTPGGTLWGVTPEGAEALLPGDQLVPLPDGSTIAVAQMLLSYPIPMGPCSSDRAGPYMTIFVPIVSGMDPPDEEREDFYGALFDPLASPPLIRFSDLNGARPTGSLCLDHPDGTVHRVLSIAKAGKRSVVDLHGGIDLAAIAAGEEPLIENEFVPVLGALALGRTNYPQRSMTIATIGGFTVDVSQLDLSAQEGSVLGPPQTLYSLPAAPLFMGSGAFTGPERREDYHVLNLSSADDEDTEPGLLFIANGDFETGDLTFGALELQACRPALSCLAAPADFDGDGVNELFVARRDRPREDPEGVEPVMMEVVRFTR